MVDWFINLPEWQIALLVIWFVLQVLLFLIDFTELTQGSEETLPMIVSFIKNFKGIMVYHILLFFLFLPYWLFCGLIYLLYLFIVHPVYWLSLGIERVMTIPLYKRKR